jgi:hypothetical protein
MRLFFAALVLTLVPCMGAQKAQDPNSTKPLPKFVPPRSGTLPDCPNTTHYSTKDLDEQSDIVLGKGKRVLALLNHVSTWFEVDPKHQNAIDASRELRQFNASFSDEMAKLQYMFTQSDIMKLWEAAIRGGDIFMEELINKLSSTLALDKRIKSEMRQLKAMGFDSDGDGWTSAKWTLERTLDPNKECYIVTAFMK